MAPDAKTALAFALFHVAPSPGTSAMQNDDSELGELARAERRAINRWLRAND